MNIRVGIGYDVHRFVPGRKLMLGGVEVDHPIGLEGHSDADVLIHAVIDSLLGAASLGDIGMLFPDTEEAFRGASSLQLLRRVYGMLTEKKIRIINIDAVVLCEKPRISPYVERMKKAIAGALGGLPGDRVGIKGKTSEGLGFAGRGEGIAVHAVSLISLE